MALSRVVCGASEIHSFLTLKSNGGDWKVNSRNCTNAKRNYPFVFKRSYFGRLGIPYFLQKGFLLLAKAYKNKMKNEKHLKIKYRF